MSKKKKISAYRFVNAKITSTISVTLVLILLGMTILIWFLGNGLSSYVKENISFSVILDTDINDAQIQRIRKKATKIKKISGEVLVIANRNINQIINTHQMIFIECDFII